MNELHDINRFPKDWGIVVFPISMSRIGNAQSPERCIDALGSFTDKLSVTKGGVLFLYTEGMYMNFEDRAFETKNKFAQNAVNHMGGIKNLVRKNQLKFQIGSAFSFESWFQMYLSHNNFFSVLSDVRKFYESDEQFRELVIADAQSIGRELDERQLSFFMEEFTCTYLLVNQQLRLRNDYVLDREEWILLAYPGPVYTGQAYLVQKDPLNINKLSSNPYKGQYNLERNVFIPYLTYDLSA